MRVRFACGPFTGQADPSDGPSAGSMQRHVVQFAQTAEAEGFDGLWLSEHHLSPDGYTSALFPLLGALAVSTDRLTIGTRAVLAPLHHPLLLAENAAQVALLSGGRFILGLAIGYRREEFAAFGVPLAERRARIVEAVTVCRQAWTGEPFDHSGPATAGRGLLCRPAPPVPPPIWLGGRAAAAIARAGRLGDGFISPATDGAQAPAMIRALDDATPAGRGPLPVATGIATAAFSDATRSRPLIDGIGRVESRYGSWRTGTGSTATGSSPRRKLNAAVGDPVAVARAIAARQLPGREQHFVLRVEWPGMTERDVHEHVRLVAREVIPRVKEMLAGDQAVGDDLDGGETL